MSRFGLIAIDQTSSACVAPIDSAPRRTRLVMPGEILELDPLDDLVGFSWGAFGAWYVTSLEVYRKCARP